MSKQFIQLEAKGGPLHIVNLDKVIEVEQRDPANHNGEEIWAVWLVGERHFFLSRSEAEKLFQALPGIQVQHRG